ncbi:MAG: hypothetical protein LQ342_003973 [Letrouitia transgressa]|nr:MAG: hypothetical protein LQ342_003973 [Letrouitia transgressa]
MSNISKGSLVLVTGANGFIGSHVVDQFLATGYKVRGTARSEIKGGWVKQLFEKKYGPGKFELAIVPHMDQKGAFGEAMKGTAGIAHVAANLVYDAATEKLSSPAVIPEVMATVRDILESAAATPSVKRFVMTSSSTAATNPKPGVKFTIKDTTWNQEAIDAAWAPPPYNAERRWDVYGASKTQAEQELWKFTREHKDIGFVANTVLPNGNFGPFLSPEHQAGGGSTATWVSNLYKDGLTYQKDIPPQYFVDVRDNARLHVAALTDPAIQNERVFAFAEPFNWNDVLHILRKLRPNHKFSPDMENDVKDLSIVAPHARAEEILKKNFSQKGFISLEESLKANIAHLD